MAMPHRAWIGPRAASDTPPADGAGVTGGAARPPRWGRWVRIGSANWALLAAGAILAASLATTAVLEARARASTNVALDLSHWVTGALELERAEDAALATQRPLSTADLAREDARFGRRSARALAGLAPAQRPGLARLADTYRGAVHTVVADLVTGQVGRARQVDAGLEATAFHAFLARVRPVARAQIAAAERDQRGADVGSLAVLGLGGLVVSSLTLSSVRLRTRSAELAGERAGLVRSEARLRALVQYGGDVVLVLDHSGQSLIWASASAVRLLGVPPDALVETPLGSLLHPGDAERLGRLLAGAGDRSGLVGQIDLRLRHSKGGWRDFETAVSNLSHQPEVAGWVLNARDVTDRRALERELRHAAYHDALTGLTNRTGFGQAMQRTLAAGTPAALILINLGGFKRVNDLYGHAAGDRLLATVAERLRTGAGAGSVVARLGGDEFGVLLQGAVDGAGVENLARRLVAAVGGRMVATGVATSVRARAGVAMADPGADPEVVRRQADFALQTAREPDASPVHRFTPETQAAMAERVDLEQDLALALDRQELVLHFQPIVRVVDGGITGLEALVRWERPGRGLAPPAAFIPAAERTGLIVPIGRWVVAEACAQLARWASRYPPAAAWRMGVNLSPRQLADPQLVDDVAGALRASAIGPGRLILEITESMVAQDAAAVVDVLSRLRALGVGVALDDFGTGYSSLSTLVRLPVDAIKIDRSFITRLGSDPLASTVLEAVIRMASGLRLEPVAEGVESVEQVDVLRRMGCRRIQGYYFARPMAPRNVEGLLSSGRLQLPAAR